MSTRRPNVPRANRNARSTGQAGGSGADRGDGAVDGPGKRVTTNDDVISAEVLHPNFGSKKPENPDNLDNPDKPDDSTSPDTASTENGSAGAVYAESPDQASGGKTKKVAGKAGGKKERSPAKAGGPAASSSTSGSASGSTPPRKKRLSASARRATERDSAKYAVRQPVVSWTRPGDAGHGSGAAPGAAGEPVPAKSFSGRLLALAVVLIAMIVILAPTVQTYVEQRMEINALQQDIAAKQAEQERLKTQLSRWEDPAYIKQQARERLFLVMPGETRYLVVGADEAKDPEQIPASPTGDEDVPWVDALFESIKRSGTD
ncbi:MAG TPA: septum formation initiator family protein [Arthrobacter sp.]|nr:septum formation initiator family protein [Arthrobacter sp.]